jgi:hypothetical protein
MRLLIDISLKAAAACGRARLFGSGRDGLDTRAAARDSPQNA